MPRPHDPVIERMAIPLQLECVFGTHSVELQYLLFASRRSYAHRIVWNCPCESSKAARVVDALHNQKATCRALVAQHIRLPRVRVTLLDTVASTRPHCVLAFVNRQLQKRYATTYADGSTLQMWLRAVYIDGVLHVALAIDLCIGTATLPIRLRFPCLPKHFPTTHWSTPWVYGTAERWLNANCDLGQLRLDLLVRYVQRAFDREVL